jgi:phosphopantothenoylcysteine decarboxylase/phosphopantothenate--cysteine ligase
VGALSGQHVVVTAGPTWEAVDDVRFLGNRSSGKMGFALAEAAGRRWARGDADCRAGRPGHAHCGRQAHRRRVRAGDARRPCRRARSAPTWWSWPRRWRIFVPACACWANSRGATAKSAAPKAAKAIPLVANPDLLAELGRARKGSRPYLVGFAAEVGVSGEALVERARAKLVREGL